MSSLTQRYLVIEHLFSNALIEQNNIKGESILQSNVFEIVGRKNDFAEICATFDQSEFVAFTQLFDKFRQLFNQA